MYEEAIDNGYSSRLSLAYRLVLERDMRDNYVAQAHHTYEYGPRIALCFNSFGCSAAFQWRAGLNGHALRLQLRVGLLLLFIRPCHSYESSVRLDVSVPLHSLPAHYWGPKLVIRGTSNVRWWVNPYGTAPEGVEYSITSDSLSAMKTGGAPESLYLCPFHVVPETRHGPHEDLQVTYVQCLWIETHYPLPEVCAHPRQFDAGADGSNIPGNNSY